MDPYDVLGIARGTSDDDARKAFHRLAKTCHPDLHPNNQAAEARFKEISAAYDAIRNPTPTPPPDMQFAWRNFRANDPFDDMFSMFGARPSNADAYMDCRMTLEEAFTGKEISDIAIPLNRPTRTIKVMIPPGVAHGMRIRVPRGGHAAHPGLPPGDLFLMIHIVHNDRFTRINNNLHITAPVSVFDVLLCREIEVIGIDGHMLRVAIPSMFDTRKLRLAGQGMPDPHNGIRGDLLVDLFIQYPLLTDQQQAMLRQLEALPR